MIEAITQCPECQTSFRVTEAQLRIAEGSVRCGACLNVFQAEDYLLSPLLDMTERLAIEKDYWLDFEDYMAQVGPVSAPAAHEEPSAAPAANKEPSATPAAHEEPSAAPAAHEEPSAAPAAHEEPGTISGDVMSFWLEYIESHATPIATPEAPAGSPVAYRLGEPSAAPAAYEEPSAAPAAYEEPSAAPAAYEEPSAAPAAYEEPGTIERDLSVVDGKSPFVDDLEKPFDLEFEPDPELLLRDHRRFFPLASLKWVPGILFLLLMLGAQWAFMNLQSFAQDEAYREQILTFCRVTGCAVPDYDNLGLLETRELIIRSHPEAPSALMVDVLLRNSGDFRQAFPGLRLQFMDVRGNVVASRVFRSQEYLGGEMRGLRYIPALTEVRLSLEIADPGENALGYQMEVVRI